MNWILKLLKPINDFMNSPRGIGHGISHGLFYGFLILAFVAFVPVWGIITLLILNHGRVLYEELFIEGWKDKPKKPDFYFDAFFRPLQADCVVLLGYVSRAYWPFIIFPALIIGFQTEDESPLLFFWKWSKAWKPKT